MRLTKLYRSLIFRLALAYVAFFVTSAFVLLGVIYWVSVARPQAQVRDTVRAEVAALTSSRQLAELRNGQELAQFASTVAAHLTTIGTEREWFYALIDRDGTVIAANFPRLPPPSDGGWTRFEIEDVELGDGREYEVLARDLWLPGGGRLVAGLDIEDLDEREDLIEDTLRWSMGIVLAFGLAGGTVMSFAVARRLEAVTKAAQRVMVGNLSGRIEVRGTGDDFDRLAQTLNAMLDRIEALIQSVTRVSDSVAHELRTPLTRLRADLEELAETDSRDEKERRRLAAQALNEAGRLQSIFDALLRIVRIETGRHAASFRDVNLTVLLRDAAEFYAPAAEDKDQRLEVQVEEDLLTYGDPDLLFQAVSNVLDNAIKYGPRGGFVRLEARERDRTVEVIITDSGPGIPAKYHARVFERFYRVPGHEDVPGVGLGLSLVAVVARLHRADLALENAEPGLRVIMRLSS